MAPQTQLATTPPAQAAATRTLERVKLFWSSRSRQQRAYLAAGAGITIATVALLTSLMLSPNRKPLIAGLEPADTQAIASQLEAKKIPFKVSDDGTSITVPADQIAAARMEVASHDPTRSGRMGFELFDKVSWGQTEFDERVNYQRALEGELERTIQTMRNVQSARVHLVMATDSVFLDRARGAKASVALRLKRGALTREQLASIQRLVAGAVDKLKPADVVIIDADSNQSLSPQGNSGNPGDELEQSLTKRLIATLTPIVGADRLRASVNIEYENGSTEESQERYDPAVSVPLAMQRTEESLAGGATAGGVPGTSSNVAAPRATNNPNAAPTTATAVREPAQSSKSETANYGVNKITRHTLEPAGRIRRLTAALLLDDIPDRHQEKGKWVTTYRKRTPEDMKLIAGLTQAAIGYNQQRGDVVSVENVGFEHAPVEEPAPLTFTDRARNGVRDYAGLLRYAMLFVLFGLVYLLLVRPVQKSALAAPEQAALAASPVLHELVAPIIESPEVVAERSLILKRQLSDFVKAEPESSATAVRAWLREGTQ